MAFKQQNIAPLQHNVPIVDPRTGQPTPQFIRYFQQLLANGSNVANGAVPTSRKINTTAPIEGGGDLSDDRTLSHADSGVAADTYGDASHVPQITVDAKGHITGVTEKTISGGGGSGPAIVTPAAADFTVTRSTLSSFAIGDSYAGGIYLTDARNSSRQNGVKAKASPGAGVGDWQVTALCNYITNSTDNYYWGGLVIMDTSAQQAVGFRQAYYADTGFATRVNGFTLSGFSSTEGGTSGGNWGTLYEPGDLPMWERLVYDDTAGEITVLASYDGVQWLNFGVVAVASYFSNGPDYVGLCMGHTVTSGTGVLLCSSFDVEML